MKWLIFALPMVGFGAGCGSDKPGAVATGASGEVVAVIDAAVLERLGDASAFETAAAKPYDAVACMRGEVEGLDVLVCHYADAAAAEASTSLKAFVVGALSGVVRKAGADVMAIADRKEVDPKGEVISRLATAFAPAP